MIALDMSLTQANRIKVYVNGVAQAGTVTNAGTALDGTNGTSSNYLAVFVGGFGAGAEFEAVEGAFARQGLAAILLLAADSFV